MKKNFTRFFIFSLIVLLVSCTKSDYTDSNGAQGSFSDHHGKWMIINYWAIWCKPCIKEIPEFNHFAKTHTDRVVLFGIDFDNAQDETLQQAISKLGIEFPVLSNDPSAILGYERPVVLPTTVIFKPTGELHRVLAGPQTEQSLLQIINNDEP
jgi:thiol-disulfide isomerase/thioredoxin